MIARVFPRQSCVTDPYPYSIIKLIRINHCVFSNWRWKTMSGQDVPVSADNKLIRVNPLQQSRLLPQCSA
ncbi:MAG: hypothetical protein P8X86_07220, partial [Desulfofustis sp.]